MGRELFDEHINAPDSPQSIILDFANVDSTSPTFFGKLTTAHKAFQATQRTFALIGVPDDTIDIFKITKLNRILSISGRDASPSGGAGDTADGHKHHPDSVGHFSGISEFRHPDDVGII